MKSSYGPGTGRVIDLGFGRIRGHHIRVGTGIPQRGSLPVPWNYLTFNPRRVPLESFVVILKAELPPIAPSSWFGL
jgi:hypothetical protein